MSRATRPLALALIALGLGAGTLCFVQLFEADSPLLLALDGTLILIDLAAMTGLTFFAWPRGAR